MYIFDKTNYKTRPDLWHTFYLEAQITWLANQCEHSYHIDVPDLLYIEIFMLFST